MFEGIEIARGASGGGSTTVLGDIGDTATNVNNSASFIMKIVVWIAVFVFGGFTVVKCVMAIQKKQQKEAILYGIGALLAFVVGALFTSDVFKGLGSEWGSGGATLSGIIGEAK